jgi:hypothetical protein
MRSESYKAWIDAMPIDDVRQKIERLERKLADLHVLERLYEDRNGSSETAPEAEGAGEESAEAEASESSSEETTEAEADESSGEETPEGGGGEGGGGWTQGEGSPEPG